MNSSLAFATISELSSLISKGKISALELVEIYAERIERYGTLSKAFISLDIKTARKQAAYLDQSKERKTLSGIPYSCKDLYDVKGLPTTAGSRVLVDNTADTDAVAIDSMNKAGAIFLGKNNLHEFAYGATGENERYGTSPNPFDQSRLAGGSSSGSVAAVGYGLCSVALGTDTGGSVRAPAALCGLVGFKPTYGRISTQGVLPYSWTLDHVGTITRTVNDAWRVFQALDTKARKPDSNISLNGLQVGLPRNFFYENVDNQILDCTHELIRQLSQHGVKFVEVTMPSMEYTRTVSLTVQMPEALSFHNRYLESRGELYSQDFRAGLALGQNLLAEQYVRAKRFIESYRRDTEIIFADVDFLLTPATPAIAPKIGVSQVRIGNYSEPAGNAITRFTSFFNMTGHPAITFPCGMHNEGLPIAAQLVGRHHEDERLLAIVELVEKELDFKAPLPDFD